MKGKTEHLVKQLLTDLKLNVVAVDILSGAVGPNADCFVQTRRHKNWSLNAGCQTGDTVAVERTGEIRYFAKLFSLFSNVLHL